MNSERSITVIVAGSCVILLFTLQLHTMRYNTIEDFKLLITGDWRHEPKEDNIEDIDHEEVKQPQIAPPKGEDKWKAVGGRNLFFEEPTEQCSDCGQFMYTEWVDNGFGPYSVQIAPYHCPDPVCGWHQDMPFSHVPKAQRPK